MPCDRVAMPTGDLVERVKLALLSANVNARGLQNPDKLAIAAVRATLEKSHD